MPVQFRLNTTFSGLVMIYSVTPIPKPLVHILGIACAVDTEASIANVNIT
ncbi:hypothetical protein UUU_02830 [Klebsiella pneumoniae subsp. pneumoniae DSM 30104 = JCM 1662 = NBRC 14940]|nr:hypothetical protein UUU_02830 [Klebsiella pneumoniae subsp. pneumoniae DSM 30104 = JCM 1662 = NBRC 14940]